jgi:hypothetical protein
MKLLNFTFILFCPILVFGQYINQTWPMGYKPKGYENTKPFGSVQFIFRDGALELKEVEDQACFKGAVCAVSDEITGELLFYSNGSQIFTSNHEIMENGDSLNCVDYEFGNRKEGYHLTKSMIALKERNNDSLFHLFHYAENVANSGDTIFKFYYTQIKLSNSIFKVEKKNIPLLNTKLCKGSLQVVKHANGHNWWIYMSDYNTDTTFRFLLHDGNLAGPFIQHFPFKIYEPAPFGPKPRLDQNVNCLITPDGKKGIRMDIFSGLSLYDVDRRTGEFSNLVYYPNWQSPAPNWLTSKNSSISISPNSRFLYLVNENKLWQLDLAASNVSDSKVLIDEYDSTKIIFISDFKESQLAPDGKIYISSYDPVVHVINNPNLKGHACNFKQHALITQVLLNGFPFIPFQDLGPLETSSENYEQSDFDLYPNPCTDYIILDKESSHAISISDIYGRLIYRGLDSKIDMSRCVNGLYFVFNHHNRQTRTFIKA